MIPWNHRAVVYRPIAGSTDAAGFPTAGFTTGVTPTGLNARPEQNVVTGLLGSSPVGDVNTAVQVWFLDAGFTDIEERDILDVVSGPKAPNRYRVHSVTKPTKMGTTVHHVEVAAKVYEGAIS